MRKHRAHLLFEAELYAALLRAARAEDRTFTAEIKKRLRESLRREERAGKAARDSGKAVSS